MNEKWNDIGNQGLSTKLDDSKPFNLQINRQKA